jgi:hypothetical protein
MFRAQSANLSETSVTAASGTVVVRRRWLASSIWPFIAAALDDMDAIRGDEAIAMMLPIPLWREGPTGAMGGNLQWGAAHGCLTA